MKSLALTLGAALGLALSALAGPPQAASSGSGGLPGQHSGPSGSDTPVATAQHYNRVFDLGLAFSPPPGALSAPYIQARPGATGAFEVVIPNTPSGFQEKFLLQVPLKFGFANYPAPLLVFFHEFGASHTGIESRTEFMELGGARNWFVLSPLGASKKHYGSLESQSNMELAVAFTMQILGPLVNHDRIYGVGFSMGGGAMLSFAARHQTNNQLRFAALVNHTGNASLKSVYVNEGVAVQDLLKFWFGGSPSLFPFDYERCSTIDYDEITGQVFNSNDMARNLVGTPIRNVVATNDPLPHLHEATENLHNHLVALGSTSELIEVFSNEHTWDNLDERETLDWLQQWTLAKPTSGRVLADREVNWHGYTIEQQSNHLFTPFEWAVDVAQNSIELTKSQNLVSWTVSLPDMGLSGTPGTVLRIESQAADASQDTVHLIGLNGPPLNVTINGTSSSNFVWNSSTKVLSITGGGAGLGSSIVVLP